MKFPSFVDLWFTSRSFVALAGLFLMVIAVPAQKVPLAPLVNPSADLDQCRDGTDGLAPCAGGDWVNGNVGSSNSLYSEDQYIAYRMRFSNLTPGQTYAVVLGYDVIHGGKHAIDYLGSPDTEQIFPRATNTAIIRPGVDDCSGVVGCGGLLSTFVIPQDPNVIGSIDPFTHAPIYEPNNQRMGMLGGTLLTVQLTATITSGGGDVEQRIAIVFTANIDDPVLAWTGHIAYAGDWGLGQSAGGINGSPYHMRLIGLCTDTGGGVITCTTGGNQDRSLSADAVIVPGILNIVKAVQTVDGSNLANTAFPFTASSNFGTANFSLVADGSSANTIQSPAINAFGAGNEIVVNEENANGWTLADITCVDNGAAGASTMINVQPFVHAGTAIVTMNEGGIETCTFTNSQLAVTAAPVTITGRVVTADGVGIRGVNVGLMDVSTGQPRTALTNGFGYYTFTNVKTEDFYVLSVGSKRYRFLSSTRSFTVTSDLADMDFVASP